MGKTRESALEALRAGFSFVQAAELAGVSRMTVYRWLQSDPGFRAAYNAWQRELVDSAQARMLKLTAKAVDVMEKALGKDNAKVAGQVLRSMGVMRRVKPGAMDAEVVSMQMELRRKRQRGGAAMGIVNHMLKNKGMTAHERWAFLRTHGPGTRPALSGPAQTGESAKLDEPKGVDVEENVSEPTVAPTTNAQQRDIQTPASDERQTEKEKLMNLRRDVARLKEMREETAFLEE